MYAFVQGEKIISKSGQELVPDESGIITIFFDGRERRFIATQFIKYLRMNGYVKPDKKRQRKFVNASRYSVKRTWTKRNERKVRTDWTRSGFKVKVFEGSDLIGEFISLSEAARAIGISKTVAHRIYYGKVKSNYKICKC
jgi:hypothetical protein